MLENGGVKVLKIVNILSFIIMVIVNALANILPINGITTGKVSDSYPNLFAPAGITFSIWGVIYLLLAGFIIYQARYSKDGANIDTFKQISTYFIISSIANSIWIFSWHYRIIPLSMILMIVILVSLIMINQKMSNRQFTPKEKIFVKIPFSVYFGWITVATIANATTLLVSLGFGGLGLSEQVWTIIIISVGAVIGTVTLLKNKDITYGIVVLWAYLGILIKHISSKGFAGKYHGIIISVSVALGIILTSVLYVAYKSSHSRHRQIQV